MGVEHGPNDRKTHTRAPAIAAGREKAVEDLCAVIGRNALAIVGDRYPQHIAVPLGDDIQPCAAVTHGVIGEIFARMFLTWLSIVRSAT